MLKGYKYTYKKKSRALPEKLVNLSKNEDGSIKFGKECGWCKKIKPLDKYGFSVESGRRHPTCQRCYQRKKARSDYGLSQEQLDCFFVKANHKCQICRNPQSAGKVRSLVIDHCHRTKKTRGILCMQCNLGIGLFKDSPTMLKLAADYLTRCKNGE